MAQNTEIKHNMTEFQKVLRNAKHVRILAGAGLSAASGLGTFRGAGGWWRKYDAVSLATPEAFRANPGRVWQFYHYRRETALKAQPNAAHYAIALFSKPEYRLKSAPATEDFDFITQNVDGISRRALASINTADNPPAKPEQGTEHLMEMHGQLFRVACTECGTAKMDFSSPICAALGGTEDSVADGVIEPNIEVKDLPKCTVCGGLLRPAVVWFGEQPLFMSRIDKSIKTCDLLLVVGTSSTVYPAAGYASDVLDQGGAVAVFNLEKSNGDEDATFVFYGGCEKTLPEALGLQDDIKRLMPGVSV